MAWSETARRIGVGVGVGGAATAVGAALLAYEARRARAKVGSPGEAPRTDGVYGSGRGTPLRLLVLGDSLAVGLGVHDPRQTFAGAVATRLARERGRPVRLVNAAKIGAESAHLPEQLERGLAANPRPDLTLVVVGANDLTHGRHWSESLRELSGTIHRLRDAGSQVVVGTCPDLGTVQPIAPPLRQLAARLSTSYAAHQREAAVEAGAHVVPLGERLGPSFAKDPGRYFGPDRFHPSADGYRLGAEAVMPAVRAALAGREPSKGTTDHATHTRTRGTERSRRTRGSPAREPRREQLQR
ncbi:MAG: SGNH/GDSL hydrolase family protein [Streptosporangiales bacterium]|nr:SGNH/GDSL hydrolase family protein [Streptosporangiales bacterium]MBO0889357.1 SGNH/GDSL hydrolase family protein [Acidothermales bacterium]